MEQNGLIKELAEAVSTQARVANRLWLTLITVVVFAFFRLAGVGEEAQTVPLPFDLGPVSTTYLYPILFAILVILAVAFASAHAQQVRAHRLARRYIDSLSTTNTMIHPQELFDILLQPSVVRVAPLAQSLRCKYQFHSTAADCPVWLWRASVVYYEALKVGAIGIYFLLPAWALWSLGEKLWKTNAVPGIFWIFSAIAGFALVQVIITEVVVCFEVLRHLRKSDASGA